jgi:short-subunit dehydrogenase
MKKILIVGASSGIGREIALIYARSGHRVAITGRRADLLRQICDLHPDNIVCACHDIAKPGSRDVMSGLVDSLGGLDLLIISAGIGFINKDLLWNYERQTIETNVSGFTDAAGFGYDFFFKQGHGHIAAISSIAGIRGIDTSPAYSASKAYNLNYLEALRKKAEKSAANITVTSIIPGFVDTAMAKGPGLFWVAKPEKAARQIIRAIENKKPIVYIYDRI